MKTMTDLSNQVIKKEIMPEKSKNVIISSDSYSRKEITTILEITGRSVCYSTCIQTVFEDSINKPRISQILNAKIHRNKLPIQKGILHTCSAIIS